MRPDIDEVADEKSKTSKKRAIQVIQELTKELVELKDGEFAALEMDPDLRHEIQIARKVTAHGARRRQLRYLCHHVADADHVALQLALDHLRSGKRADADHFQNLELFREQLIGGDEKIVAEIAEKIPNCDTKQLRRLQVQAQTELKQGKSVAAARALFRFLRQAAASQPAVSQAAASQPL